MRTSARRPGKSLNRDPKENRGGSGFLNAAALILAGGQGRRAGGSKLFMAFDGVYLVERLLEKMPALFSQVILSCRAEEAASFRRLFGSLFSGHDLRIVTDRAESVGPLEGISVGLHASDYPWVFVFGCDMPMIQDAVVRFMWSKKVPETDAVIARIGGFIEPLHAFYHKRCAVAVDEAITRCERKISSFLANVTPLIVDEGDMEHIPGFKRSFMNINTPADMRKWLEETSGSF